MAVERTIEAGTGYLSLLWFTTILGPIWGPIVAVSLGSLAGSLYRLSANPGQGVVCGLFVLFKNLAASVALTSTLSWMLAKLTGMTLDQLLIPTSFLVSAFGDQMIPWLVTRLTAETVPKTEAQQDNQGEK